MVFVVYTSVQGGVRARATSFVALALESERECACAEKTVHVPVSLQHGQEQEPRRTREHGASITSSTISRSTTLRSISAPVSTLTLVSRDR